MYSKNPCEFGSYEVRSCGVNSVKLDPVELNHMELGM